MHSWAFDWHSPLRFLALAALAALFALPAAPAHAADDALQAQVREFASASVLQGPQRRIEVEVGSFDPRLKLAPCEEIQPYLPPNARLWGRSRIGLRCTKGPTRWNVYLPVTVKVFAKALVATRALPVGTVIEESDLAQAEVDLAEDASAAVTQAQLALGRALERPLAAGASLRQSHLKPRQWFAAGETVQLVAQGPGFQVGGSGQALNAGIEGQPVRIRTDSGRVLTAEAVGERRAEVNP
ncbi:MAG: flagellar basal body P-ring formation protein FlgA [Piscinibacter sp.]|uniref:flagellar basal body P-ring formation chaperone FlgA n=1 Tax=Piscinibacter sp. TaxID=1903157 RepID=UPI001B40CFFD|nr:flagellar basal body P-ring formation chaperone FlgA [Piscinibacter sp.]MBP5988653.1 flagellar basal body P-ring formation protein FlgA [Piscinibacter sp.]MBP6025858.1 flagellar basal body P-ring formation protein FlgA [Piscinibacter sp.]